MLSIGTTARFDLADGDSYIGEVTEIHGDTVTIQNYSAWYADATAPYSNPYFDDEVQFQIDAKTHVEQF